MFLSFTCFLSISTNNKESSENFFHIFAPALQLEQLEEGSIACPMPGNTMDTSPYLSLVTTYAFKGLRIHKKTGEDPFALQTYTDDNDTNG